MTIHKNFLFYSKIENDTSVILDDDESRHAGQVLRAVCKDELFITNGKGAIRQCRIEEIDKRKCITSIINSRNFNYQKPLIHLYVGLPEKDAFEFILNSTVPLGVTSITPVVFKYCQKRWWDKWEKYTDRFDRKIIVAGKQSWNSNFPTLLEPVSFDSAIQNSVGKHFFADENGSSILKHQDNQLDVTSLYIGPPGGISNDEKIVLKQKGAVAISLGKNRLRTELASTILVGNFVHTFVVQ